MKLSISHDTTYRYDDPVRASIQYLRLTPHDSERQQVLSWQLDLPRPVHAQLDPYGNILHVLTLDEPHESIVIGARGQVEIDEACEAEHERQSALPFLRFTRLTQADDAAEMPEDVHEATDAVDEGLALVRSWEQRGVDVFRGVAFDLLRFGARVYARYQPQFLDEFIAENTDPALASEGYVGDSDMRLAVHEAQLLLVDVRDSGLGARDPGSR